MQLGIVADTKMLCRVCMVPVEEHPANLYDDASPFGLPSLHNMLRTICAPVFAKPEAEAIVPNMPTIVCLVCQNAIVAAYNLHQQCIETDRRLGELVALMWELQGPGGVSEAVRQEEQGQVRENEPIINVKKTCLDCGKTFTTGGSLKRHKNEGRCEGPNGSLARTCVICCQVFKTVKLLRKHRQIHEGTEEAESNEAELPAGEWLNTEPVDVIKVEADENEEAANEVGVFNCTDCGISFTSTVSYQKHTLEGNCQGKQLFSCSLCGQTFNKEIFLKCHMRKHRARVACLDCNLEFKNRKLLRSHKKSYRCSGNKTKTSLAMRQEENSQTEKQHQMQGEQPSLKDAAKMNVELDIQCANCGVTFKSNRAHQNHTKDGNCQRMIIYPCKECGMVFDKLARLYYHMFSHKERAACSKCGATFSNKSGLVRHLNKNRCPKNKMQEQSENQAGQQTPTFPCKVCGQIFHSYTKMLYHRRNHQKRVACPHCGQLFRNKNILHAHIRARRCLIDSASSSQTVVNEEPLEIIKVEEPQIMDT